MRPITYPSGHVFHEAGWCDGSFWVVTRRNAGGWATEWGATEAGGHARVIPVPAGTGDWAMYRYPVPAAVPGQPGLSLAWFLNDGPVAVDGRTGETTRPAGDRRPPTPAGYANIRANHEWKAAARLRFQAWPEGRTRVAYSDAAVVMTGSAADGLAGPVMGPTAAAAVLSVRGLGRNHVVVYPRGGTARVLRLPRMNPLHLALAPDGLTVLATCLREAVVLDVE